MKMMKTISSNEHRWERMRNIIFGNDKSFEASPDSSQNHDSAIRNLYSEKAYSTLEQEAPAVKSEAFSSLSSRSFLHRSFALNKIVSEELTLKRNTQEVCSPNERALKDL